MTRKLNKVEKTIIDLTDKSKFYILDCKQHGIYASNKENNNKNCPQCGIEGEDYESK